MAVLRSLLWMLAVALLGGVIAATAWYWGAWISPSSITTPATAGAEAERSSGQPKMLELSPQARQNLGLVSRPATLSNSWRSIIVPGEVMDRPGLSDRGVTSPAVGVVTQIHAFAGDTIHPGDTLFTLRLLSEYIQNTQSELFKVTRDIELETEKRQRLSQIGDGAIPQVPTSRSSSNSVACKRRVKATGRICSPAA